MPSWTEVQGYLRSRYRLQTDEAQHFVIGFSLEGGSGLTGPLIQGVQGQLIEVNAKRCNCEARRPASGGRKTHGTRPHTSCPRTKQRAFFKKKINNKI